MMFFFVDILKGILNFKEAVFQNNNKQRRNHLLKILLKYKVYFKKQNSFLSYLFIKFQKRFRSTELVSF